VWFTAQEPVGADLERIGKFSERIDGDMLADPRFQTAHVDLVLADTVTEGLLSHMELLASLTDTVAS
jgi:hypothetical protein